LIKRWQACQIYQEYDCIYLMVKIGDEIPEPDDHRTLRRGGKLPPMKFRDDVCL